MMKQVKGILLALIMMIACNHSPAPGQARDTQVTIMGLRFAKIPPGSFHMGSSGLDGEKAADEMPRHTVRISRAFYLGTTEVTVSQFRKFASETNREVTEYLESADGTLAVADVSWQETQDFIQWLNTKDTRHAYRLPTEAEWEYACRAESTGPRFFDGEKVQLSAFAWYWKNSGKRVHPVGKLKANSWGLFDMYGNVYEWVSDWYNETYYQESPRTDPKGPESGSARVYRGGGWSCNPDYCRSSFRNYGPPEKKSQSVGFRLVMKLR